MADHLTRTFAALADPTRRALLAQLSRGEANVTALATPFLKEMSLPAVTKHLQVLERAGLITKARHAQWRPCKLNADALKDVADWMEPYRVFWEESFDRLEAYLKTVTAKAHAKADAKADARDHTKGKKRDRQKSLQRDQNHPRVRRSR